MCPRPNDRTDRWDPTWLVRFCFHRCPTREVEDFMNLSVSQHGLSRRVFFPDAFPYAFSGLSKGVAKSSHLLRTLVVPRGRTVLVLAVRVSTCLARVPMTLSCSSDFFENTVNVFLNSSSAAVLASALTAEMFAAGVLLMSSPESVPFRFYWLFRLSIELLTKHFVAVR